ncbi:high mobility group B protein 10-like [Cryptomeria japonica]|uniref:high mobility group B protein 10-like n=1 Tax=Cryptomeria japonica TaxID=3369 RepID=UPI0027DA5AC1|nr:high mobility group B protein 10-like [Cryptomeria japonica]
MYGKFEHGYIVTASTCILLFPHAYVPAHQNLSRSWKTPVDNYGTRTSCRWRISVKGVMLWRKKDKKNLTIMKKQEVVDINLDLKEQFREVPSYLDGDAALGVRHHRRHMRKYEIKKNDSDYLKQNRSGYTFFFAEQYTKLKALHLDKDREISKMIGDSWRNLSEEEKSVYHELALKDKERNKNHSSMTHKC